MSIEVDFNSSGCYKTEHQFTSSKLITLIVLIIVNCIVISSNLLVICIILFNKHLRSVNSNLFILSLAASDLMLGLFVLPVTTASQTIGSWLFGSVFCRISLALDVWLCTASIYNLVIITIDRFIAVTKPLAYKAIITSRKVIYMILSAWTCSFCLAVPLLFIERSEVGQCRCSHLSNVRSYVLGSSTISFYVPFVFILYFYFRIYTKVRTVTSSTNQGFIKLTDSRSSSDSFGSFQTTKSKTSSENTPLKVSKETVGANVTDSLRIHRGVYCPKDKIPTTNNRCGSVNNVDVTSVVSEETSSLVPPSSPKSRPRSQTWEGNTPNKIFREFPKLARVAELNGSLNSCVTSTGLPHPRSVSSLLTKHYESSIMKYQKRLLIELKTLKTVGVVTGCVLLSWIGFCVVYALESLQIYKFTETTVVIFMWLGYLNSAINPFIYAGYNRQYRQGLKTLLKCGQTLDTCENQTVFSGSTFSSSRKPS